MQVGKEIDSLNLSFAEALYADYLNDPASVPDEWRAYFESWRGGNGATHTAAPRTPAPRPIASRPAAPREATAEVVRRPPVAAPVVVRPPAATAAITPPAASDVSPRQPAPRSGQVEPATSSAAAASTVSASTVALRQERLDRLVRAYRVRGHLIAKFDPLGRPRRVPGELKPESYGFTEDDLDLPCSTQHMDGADVRTLRSVLDRMQATYCRWIGVQFMHIDDAAPREWLVERMEGTENRLSLTKTEQLRILKRLADAVILEQFIQKKYLGAKSFSLEGGETLIPLLDLAIDYAGEQGVHEIVLAMAHRGRLNVLANIMGKSPAEIFREFEDVDSALHQGRVDVKYHLGYSSDWLTAQGKKVHLSLCFNPSHLEFVNPVALGRARAKQDRAGDRRRERGMAVLIHGDAAFAGQGVVQETLNLSELDGYTTGGALHIIVNNQVGFTTGPEQARSSVYATDVAKMLQSPIFHVNGEEPEAVAQVVRLALDFRETFKRDVVIDMYCYRRRGHNEGDEPSFTQPQMYRAIENRVTVWQGYLEHLLLLGDITAAEAERIGEERRAKLEHDLNAARSEQFTPPTKDFQGIWSRYTAGPERDIPEVDTGLTAERLSALLAAQAQLPPDFHPHSKIGRLLQTRQEMAAGRQPLDWAAAEALALGSLATQGVRVRLTGQDAERGTFSHRHAMLHDYENGQTWMPLAHLSPTQAPLEIYNSPLSEVAVMGFEYGYALDCPDGLIAWEAQFGDFTNVAQVIIDQFLTSAEDKWRRANGLVLLLPHGFEGMGPEHSSARLERFLAAAARDNIQVAVPTTPAQIFHLLRRQALRTWRKPLVVMTPKSLLRNPRCVSSLEDLASGRFQRVIPDSHTAASGSPPERVLLCSGKIFYELQQKREAAGRQNVDIVRIEQLYPLPLEPLRQALERYPDGTPLCWVQEEPENMGAWRFLWSTLGERPFDRFSLRGILRPAAAAPATGSASSHKQEQEALLNAAFTG